VKEPSTVGWLVRGQRSKTIQGINLVWYVAVRTDSWKSQLSFLPSQERKPLELGKLCPTIAISVADLVATKTSLSKSIDFDSADPKIWFRVRCYK